MSDLEISGDLVGQRVRHATRPEWGVGTVLRVQQLQAGAAPAFRVSIQFAAGHRLVLVPPGRLLPPTGEPTRQSGWLDQVSGRTLDDRLAALPESLTTLLGTAAQRIKAVAELYEWTGDPAALASWARRQAGVADPLEHWTRDELAAAFTRFCQARDAYLRDAAAAVRRVDGAVSLAALLSSLPPAWRERMLAVL